MQIHSLHLKPELPSHWSWFMLILKVPFKSNQLQEDTFTGFNLLMIALDSSVVLDSERNQKPLLHFCNSNLMLRICIMPKSKFLGHLAHIWRSAFLLATQLDIKDG